MTIEYPFYYIYYMNVYIVGYKLNWNDEKVCWIVKKRGDREGEEKDDDGKVGDRVPLVVNMDISRRQDGNIVFPPLTT